MRERYGILRRVSWKAVYSGSYPGGPLLRIVRAEKHLTELEGLLRDFLDGRPYQAVPETHRNGTENTIRYRGRVRRDPPTWAGPVIGDVIHNLRAALDNSVSHIALQNGANSAELGRSQFPIHTYRRDYLVSRPGHLAGCERIKCLPLGARAIVHKCQPYRTRNDPELHALRLLQWLSNRDKHRQIHVGGAFVREVIFVPTAMHNTEVIRQWIAPSGPFEDGAVLAELTFRRTGPNASVDMDEQFPFDIAFENAGPATDLTVVPLLRQLVEYVTAVVDALMPYIERPFD